MTSNGRRPPMEEYEKIWKVEDINNHWSEDDLKIWKVEYLSNHWSDLTQIWNYGNLKLKLIGSNQSVQRYQMKMTSNGRRPPTEDDLKIWKVEYINNHWSDLTQILNWSYSVQRYQMKTTSNGRQPQNMKRGISQQPLVGSYSNLKLKLLGSNQGVQRYQMRTTSNGRQP